MLKDTRRNSPHPNPWGKVSIIGHRFSNWGIMTSQPENPALCLLKGQGGWKAVRRSSGSHHYGGIHAPRKLLQAGWVQGSPGCVDSIATQSCTLLPSPPPHPIWDLLLEHHNAPVWESQLYVRLQRINHLLTVQKLKLSFRVWEPLP